MTTDLPAPTLISTLSIEKPEEDIITVEVIGEETSWKDELELLESMAGEGRKRHGGARCAAREV